MTDLVKKLRECADVQSHEEWGFTRPKLLEAADEIERLETDLMNMTRTSEGHRARLFATQAAFGRETDRIKELEAKVAEQAEMLSAKDEVIEMRNAQLDRHDEVERLRAQVDYLTWPAVQAAVLRPAPAIILADKVLWERAERAEAKLAAITALVKP